MKGSEWSWGTKEEMCSLFYKLFVEVDIEGRNLIQVQGSCNTGYPVFALINRVFKFRNIVRCDNYWPRRIDHTECT